MKRVGMTLGLLGLVVAMALPALAASDLVIDLPHEVVRTRANSVWHLKTVTTPTELVGRECAATARAANNRSVHEGNDLLVVSGGETAVLANVERAAGVDTGPSDAITLSESVGVYLDLGPEGIYSAAINVVLTCAPEETTTTSSSVPETTTTVPGPGETTTTVPGPGEETTTTSSVPEITTTTAPGPGETTTTTVPVTTIPPDTTVTTAPPATTAPTTPPTLPHTGAGGTAGLGIGGAALVALGLALVRSRGAEGGDVA